MDELVEWNKRDMEWVPCTNISPRDCRTRKSTLKGGRKSRVKKHKKRKTKKYNTKK
jgi:hypothetical protein